MPIPQDRLDLQLITDAPVANFSSSVTDDILSNTKSISDGYFNKQVTSPLTPQSMLNNPNLSSGLGIFGNNCDTGYVPKSVRNSYYGNSFNRSGYGNFNNSVCPKTSSMFGLDKVLGNISGLNDLSSFKTMIPIAKGSMLDGIISSEITKTLGKTLGGLISIPLCLLSAIGSGVLGALGKTGSSLFDKLGLRDLFSNKLTECFAKAFTTAGVNNTITNIATGSIINNSLGLGRTTGANTIDGMLNNGYTTRENIYNGFSYSLSQPNDKNTEDKLYLLNATTATDNDPTSLALSSTYTRANIDNVMTNLSSSEKTSNIPSDDYDNITKGLDQVDNNWDKDSEGDNNLYRSIGNDRLSELAEAKVGGNTDYNYTGDLSNDFTRAETINILNNVA